MSEKDKFHDVVKDALKDDGWRVTHDQFPLNIGGIEMYIDLAAEPLIATEAGIANELVELGISHDDIVLAYFPDFIRPYTGFAVA